MTASIVAIALGIGRLRSLQQHVKFAQLANPLVTVGGSWDRFGSNGMKNKAAALADVEIVRLLLGTGADPAVRNRSYWLVICPRA